MQRHHEKSDKKVGGTAAKPIVSMLSQLKIQIPKPQSARKISFSSGRQNSFKSPNSKAVQQEGQNACLQPVYQNNSREDYAAALLRLQMEQSDLRGEAPGKEKGIIMQWVKTLFQKRNLLGIHWQQKIRVKRKDMLRQAFNCIKEGKESCHSFLKTQSKHHPQPQRFNQLLVIGLDKMADCFERCSAKRKRQAFHYTLRFLAFKRNNNNHATQAGGYKKNNIESPKRVLATSLPNQHNDYAKIIQANNQALLRQVKPHQNEDYSIFTHSLQINSLKKAKSSNFIPLMQNQYALSPKSPIKQFREQKVFAKEDHNTQLASSKLSRNSDRSRIQRELVQSRSQPQVAIGGIGGNFKYEFNQHNYIVVQPENMQYPYHPQQQMKEGPPSPMLHQQVVRIEQPNRQPINLPLTFVPQQQESSRLEVKRDLNYTRPHSHNPFNPIVQSHPIIQKQVQQQPEARKSRAVSVSANIKISFKSREDSKPQAASPFPNEYQMGKQLQMEMMHKLASPESKRLRQSYQVNNFNHDLFPKEYVQSPQTPRGNYIHFAGPNSPRAEDHKSLSIKFLNPGEPNQSNPTSPRTPRGICYKSFIPPSAVEKVQMKRSVQIAPETPRRSTREKILVTSAMGLRST